MKNANLVDKQTGELFEILWPQYDDRLFEESIQLFFKRLDAWGMSHDFFKNKKCLDAGCGGGRYTIAMARLGACATGIDLGREGIEDAKKRAAGLNNASFRTGSVEILPFEDESFDIVVNSGVLQHTVNPAKALNELSRVLKRGGSLYLLVYATGGLKWPLISQLRPLAAQIGLETMEEAIKQVGAPPNKRRIYLDDLFCPVIDFYTWTRLSTMLQENGFTHIRRMPRDLLDHESSLSAYFDDIKQLSEVFQVGGDLNLAGQAKYFNLAFKLCRNIMDIIERYLDEVLQEKIPEGLAMDRVIGQGHHRVWTVKEGQNPA